MSKAAQQKVVVSGVVVKKKHDFCVGSWVFFFRGLVGFGKEQVIRCSFFVRGGDVCGAVVWQPSDWMENHVQAVLHTKLCQKMHLKTPVSSSSLRWP